MFRPALLILLVAEAAAMAAEPVVTPAPSGLYVTDPTHTSLTWKINHFGLSSYTARFTGVSATLAWNADAPAASKLTVTIDPRSVRTDFPFPKVEDFDRKIGTAPEFLADQPIRYEATSITLGGDRTGAVIGDLTFRGKTHPVALDVRFNGSMAEHPMDKTPRLGFSATGSFKRTDWGLDFATPALGETVELLIETEFMLPKK